MTVRAGPASRPESTAGTPTSRHPNSPVPASSVVSARPIPAVPAALAPIAESSASRGGRPGSASRSRRTRPVRPRPRSGRGWRWPTRPRAAVRTSRRRASHPVSHGTSTAATNRLTARMRPAAGSRCQIRTIVSDPASSADPNAGTTRTMRSCSASTSRTILVNRSPRRNAGRPGPAPAAPASRWRYTRTRRSASRRKAAPWPTSRSP